MRVSLLLSLLAVLLLASTQLVSAQREWSKDDIEIFQLQSALEKAEGPGTTFYSIMNLTKSATAAAIKKNYRLRSMELHPDKHPEDPKASERFKRLGLVNKILRDERRDSHGFPKWRSQVGGLSGFYYSRWRPGLAFAIAVVVLVTCVLQHIIQRINYERDTKRLELLTEHAKLQAWGPSFRSKPNGVRPERKVRVPLQVDPLPAYNADPIEEERTLKKLLARGLPEGPKVDMKISESGLWLGDGEGNWEEIGTHKLEVPSASTLWPVKLLRRITGPPSGAGKSAEKAYDEASGAAVAVSKSGKKSSKKE
ncbi:DnaJ-domain-containing protein [Ceraceosorus guamensis]|uniref:DnaJ-domain-containing protein n=1 Tax=Ceraceosorus guamensis TaxID=1522189 RepID=A0A316VTJ0_9BASI|nr:DnaJ-domain-containing protein [Ceraceosorus guamensis]PWN40812.1 DnaJ-domain-containing protein [Ceraceosorus guamensis]